MSGLKKKVSLLLQGKCIRKQLVILLIFGVFLFAGEISAFALLSSPGKLSNVHKKLEGVVNCLQCHKLFKGIDDSACLVCHKKIDERIKSSRGLHAGSRNECSDCHKEHEGEDADIIKFDKDKFDHRIAGFNLIDKHKLECNKCHKQDKTYMDLTPECLYCHADTHYKTVSEDCSKCHSFKGWKALGFDHQNNSEFILTGKHSDVKCQMCHPKSTVCEICHPKGSIKDKTGYKDKVFQILKFKPLKYEKCNDCHDEVHKAELKEKTCKGCHITEGWKEIDFDHTDPLRSDFRISGKHEKASCGLCHPEERSTFMKDGKRVERVTLRLKPVKYKECNNCHYDLHKGQFKDRTCDDCHSVQNVWKETTFSHEAKKYMGFKLEGRHKDADCLKCHERSEVSYSEFKEKKKAWSAKFKPLKYKACNDCHYDLHKGQFKDRTCDDCHSVQNAWKENTFNHEDKKYGGYKLKGKHKDVVCEKCHERNEIIYTEFNEEKKAIVSKFGQLKSERCDDCHKDEHKPDLKAISHLKDVTCVSCHSVENDWKDRLYKHIKGSRYHSAGAGTESLTCAKCHMCDPEVFTFKSCFKIGN